MFSQSELDVSGEGTELESAADEAIAALDGDAREAVKALIALTYQLEDQLALVSYGYARGKVGLVEAR